MPSGKQNILRSDELPLSSAQSAAVNAHKRTHEGAVPATDELTSLNKLLQWSSAHSAQGGTDSATPPTAGNKPDREWLNAMFPDMNAGIKEATALLNTALDAKEIDDAVDALSTLEEYLADMNYARNVGPLGILPPLLRSLTHLNAGIRAGAAWATGSLLQDLPSNCELACQEGLLQPLAALLADENAVVRAKAVRAVSALLRAAPPALRDTFAPSVSSALVACVADEDARVRSRTCFLVAHAAHSGNAWLLDAVTSRGAHIVTAVTDADASDTAAVEPILGTISALVERNRASLLTNAPSLVGALDALAARCDDDELCTAVEQVARSLK